MKNTRIVFAVLILASIILASTTASGENPDGQGFLYWFDKEAEYYISFDSGYLVRGNNVVVVTYKEKLATGQNWLIGEVFNCPTEQYTLSSLDEFDKNHKIVSRYKNENPGQTYKPVNLSDRQGALLNGICTGIPKRPELVDEVRQYFEDFEKDVKKIRDSHKNENAGQTYKPLNMLDTQGALLNGIRTGIAKRPDSVD